MTAKNADMLNNTVMDVLQNGYTLNGRLIRPARVRIVKND
jgi:molecular chaperone GrpE (heat shock protein)